MMTLENFHHETTTVLYLYWAVVHPVDEGMSVDRLVYPYWNYRDAYRITCKIFNLTNFKQSGHVIIKAQHELNIRRV